MDTNDLRETFSSDEEATSQTSPTNQKASVSSLPFSVETLIGSGRGTRSDLAQQNKGMPCITRGELPFTIYRDTVGSEDFPKHLIPSSPVKSETSEHDDAPSWATRSRLSSPTSK